MKACATADRRCQARAATGGVAVSVADAGKLSCRLGRSAQCIGISTNA